MRPGSSERTDRAEPETRGSSSSGGGAAAIASGYREDPCQHHSSWGGLAPY